MQKTNLPSLFPKEEKDDYKDPRETEVIHIGVERLEEDNGHFMVVGRNIEGKIFFRDIAHYLDGLGEKLRQAVEGFYLPLEHQTDPENLEKDKAFLKKKAEEEMRKKQ